MRRSLRARLIAGYVILVTLLGGATVVVIERTIAGFFVGEIDDRMVAQARAIGEWLHKRGEPHKLAPRLAWVTAADVVIVGTDGIVKGDSVSLAHVGQPVGAAPEVAAARERGVGRAERRLEPDGPVMYLVAVRNADGRVVRVARPLSSVEDARTRLRGQVLVIGAIGLGAALLLGLWAIRAVTRPIQAMTRTAARLARGDYAVAAPPPGPARDELDLLSRTLALLAAELRSRIGELVSARDLSAAVLDALVEGVVAVDADGKVALANRAATRLLGDGAPPPLTDGETTIAGRQVRVATRPLAGGTVAVLYDVTQLRSVDRLRRDFLASAAHELRTPVTAISGYAETLLGDQVRPDAQREFLDAIHRNADRIARLVDDLLELERIGARPERIAERAPIALAPVVAHAARTAQTAASARGASEPTIEVAIAPALAVLGDRDGLEHVVQNLIDNAVFHGGGAVRVTARQDGARVVLAVEDDGPGIAPEHRARVFERFYRIDAGRSRARGGSGLGLAIVAEQVAALGGVVRVEDSARGARFVVELDAAP